MDICQHSSIECLCFRMMGKQKSAAALDLWKPTTRTAGDALYRL
jgi:hypothetical protein